MSTEYTFIRVPSSIAKQLRDFSMDLERQAERGQLRLPDRGNTGRPHCPQWFALQTLLDRLSDHRRRSAESGARRTLKRRTARGCKHPLALSKGVAA